MIAQRGAIQVLVLASFVASGSNSLFVFCCRIERVNDLVNDFGERFARIDDDRIFRFFECRELAFHQFFREKMG